MAKQDVYDHVRLLRAQGLTYKEINEKLSINTSKSTLSYWCKDIILTPEQNNRIQAQNLKTLAITRQMSVAAGKQRRLLKEVELVKANQHLKANLWNSADNVKIALALLYLAEGAKRDTSSLMFGNSDPRIIKLFLRLLRRCYDVDETKFRCTVQCRSDQDVEKLNSFWSRVTRIPRSQFYAARIDARSIGKRTLKAEYKGVCRLDYFSASIYNELQIVSKVLTS